MNENRHPEIRWLDAINGQETEIRFVGPLRLHNSPQNKTNMETNMAQRYSRKLWLACLAFAGLMIVAIGLMSGGNLFAHNANDTSSAADKSDAGVGWIMPQASALKSSMSLTDSTAAADATATDADQASLNAAKSLSNAFRSVSQKVLPTVVAIENRPLATKQASSDQVPSQRMPEAFEGNPFEGTPFEKYFGEGFRGVPSQPGPGQGTPRGGGVGSGVIVDPAGLILTNNHVVEGDGEITVRLQDGREFVADQVYTDPKTDVALIKVMSSERLPAAVVGNSDMSQVGDWVLALGQPFGLESTVTAGIISAKGRAMGITDREDFIQTDAAINPGNSGGPLVNLEGHVIGINTAISSRGGGNDGVGFAVPVNLAKWVADELIDDGVVQRAYLGVGIQSISQTLANQFNVAPRSGLLITQVVPGSPAEAAGVRHGDVMIEFAGRCTNSPSKLQTVVERSEIGNEYDIKLLRDGKEITLTYVARENAGNASQTASAPTTRGRPAKFEQLGLQIDNLDAAVASRLNLDGVSGVVITGIKSGSPAAKAGLQSGLVISQVNRIDVSSKQDFETAVADSDLNEGILLLVHSANGSQFVVLQG